MLKARKSRKAVTPAAAPVTLAAFPVPALVPGAPVASELPPAAPAAAPAADTLPGTKAQRAQAAMRSGDAGAFYLAIYAGLGGDATGKRFPVKPVPVAPGVLRGAEFTIRSASAILACAIAHAIPVQAGARIPLRFADSLYLESGAAHDAASRYGCSIEYTGADCAIIAGEKTRALLARGVSEKLFAQYAI